MRAALVIALLFCVGCAAQAQTAFHGAPNFAEAQSVCEAVADGSAVFIQAGADGFIHADIDNDGVEDVVRVDHEGMLVPAEIKVMDSAGEFQDFYYELDLDMGVAPYPPWERLFRFLRIGGRVYGVSFSSSGPNWVAYDRQDFEELAPWLCRFEVTATPSHRAPSGDPWLDFQVSSRVSGYNPALYPRAR